MFKVLREDHTSFNIGNLKYGIGLWVKPEFGKLFVFDTIENARASLPRWRKKEFLIYGCSVRGEVKRFYGKVPQCRIDYKKFWAGNWDGCEGLRVPSGTLLVDEIKLEYLCASSHGKGELDPVNCVGHFALGVPGSSVGGGEGI